MSELVINNLQVSVEETEILNGWERFAGFGSKRALQVRVISGFSISCCRTGSIGCQLFKDSYKCSSEGAES